MGYLKYHTNSQHIIIQNYVPIHIIIFIIQTATTSRRGRPRGIPRKTLYHHHRIKYIPSFHFLLIPHFPLTTSLMTMWCCYSTNSTMWNAGKAGTGCFLGWCFLKVVFFVKRDEEEVCIQEILVELRCCCCCWKQGYWVNLIANYDYLCR